MTITRLRSVKKPESFAFLSCVVGAPARHHAEGVLAWRMINPDAPVRNRVLAALTSADLDRLIPQLEPVSLTQGALLFEPDTRLTHVHFPLNGMVSLVAVMQDGDAVETTAIGPEGAVGLVQALGTGQVYWRGLVQLSGRALRIERRHLQVAALANRSIGAVFASYNQAQMMQVLQLAACNARHPVDARLARWLLTSQDCVEGDVLPLTQEFLAQMLGVRRTTVTQAAKRLQRAGTIAYRRGVVRVLKRSALEQASCECHALIQRRFHDLMPSQPG